jgi:hypothetical protein
MGVRNALAGVPRLMADEGCEKQMIDVRRKAMAVAREEFDPDANQISTGSKNPTSPLTR